jgi:NAD(P)-dependent dehydrogenase (short-subunit alcohol dehydrogenase family)
MPYAVTKAAQLQLVKCLAVTVGPKIRVNTVLPGLLLTEWVRNLPLPIQLTYPSPFPATHCLLPTPFQPQIPSTVNVVQGLKYPPERIEALKAAAKLKHETYLEDCVDAYIMLAKNTSMTGMRIQVDAGLNVQGA